MEEEKENKKYTSQETVLLYPEIREAIEKKDLGKIKKIISGWYAPDIANLFEEIDIKDSAIILRLIPEKLQSEVFSKLDSDVQEKMIRSLTDGYIKSIIEELEADDRTELFEEMPPGITRRLVNLLSQEERKEALELLGYPKDSVGRLMNPDYLAIKMDWTVQEAIEHIRKFGKTAETINVVYVVDNKWHLLDEIRIQRLILASPEQSVESIMDRQFVSITAASDQEEAIKLFEKYDLIILPVTDSEGHLLGIVTSDDIIDVIREEQTEDFTKFSAIEAGPVGLKAITKIKDVPLREIFQARITWLLALLIMDLVTGGIIQSFRATIAKYVVLVTFLPVLVDTSGNAGSQSATLVIRALALGTVKMRDWIRLLGRELLIGAALGTVMGLGISVMGIIRGGSFQIARVVVMAMVVNVMVGSLIGVLLPFIFTKFKKDPATASTPLITTLADIIGTGVFLEMAHLLLG